MNTVDWKWPKADDQVYCSGCSESNGTDGWASIYHERPTCEATEGWYPLKSLEQENK